MNMPQPAGSQRFRISGDFPYAFDQLIPKGTKISHEQGSTTLARDSMLTLKAPLGGDRFEIELQEVRA